MLNATQAKRYRVRIEINPGYVYRRVVERDVVATSAYKALAHAMALSGDRYEPRDIGEVTVEEVEDGR